jgi:HD-GYP domain-containing protein (c-di-GMP phosphodiesterase class II)
MIPQCPARFVAHGLFVTNGLETSRRFLYERGRPPRGGLDSSAKLKTAISKNPLSGNPMREQSSSESALRKHIEKLNRVGIALSNETNLERLLELIVTEARGFTRADAGSLYTLDNGRLHFRIAQNDTMAKRGRTSAGFTPYSLCLSENSIAGYVAGTARVLNIKDVYRLPPTAPYRFNPEFDLRNHYVTRSVLAVPLQDQTKEILGVLQLVNATLGRTVGPFPKSVERLVLSLASQAAIAIRNATLIADVKALFSALIRYSASAIDARSPHTAGHSKRVAGYAEAIARAINRETSGPLQDVSFTSEQIEELVYAAWLHDIGKIGVPECILDKGNRLSDEAMATIATRFALIKALNRVGRSGGPPCAGGGCNDMTRQGEEETEKEIDRSWAFIARTNGSFRLSEEDSTILRSLAAKTYQDLDGTHRPYLTEKEVEALSVREGNLTANEYSQIQRHVEHTYNIVKNVPFTKPLKNVPLYAVSHHEFLNGKGYPRRLKAHQIPVQARILAVADIFDALTAVDRPYRNAVSIKRACETLGAHAGAGRIDADIVDLFIRKKLYQLDEDTSS